VSPLFLTWANSLAKPLARWWQGILARTLLAVIGIVMLLGGVSSIWVSQSVGEREYRQAVQGLGELLDTVESTASIACFASDEQLAAEVAQGLMRNRDVRRVVIRAGERELVSVARGAVATVLPRKLGADDTAVRKVERTLVSPFNRGEIVGEIALDADWLAIDARVRQSARYTVMLLVGQLALVVVALAASMLYLVVRPIKATSDRLHQLDPSSGMQLSVPEGHDNSEIGRLVDDINDLTGRLVATLDQERSLREQQAIAQRKYQDLFDHAASGIFVADRTGRLVSFNRAFAALTWMPKRDQTAGRSLAEIGWQESGHVLVLLLASLDQTAGHLPSEGDFLLKGRRGDERWLHVAVIPVGDGSVQGTVTDVTQRKYEELSARRLAVTDSLTGFANRTGLQHLLAELKPHDAPFALAMMDLDGFKQINDALGFPIGDQMLLAVAARIRELMAESDEVARIGGDEFAWVLAGETERERVGERIAYLLAAMSRPFNLGTPDNPVEISISGSVGVAFFPADGIDLHRLLRSAELALNNMRAGGGRGFRYFDPALQAAVEHRRRLEDDLRQALAGGQLHLVFQPIIDIAAGRLAGAEALLRWEHPVRGMVSPETFIPLAEELGLIGEIGAMVLDEACRQVAVWRRDGLDMYVSVNVSVRQIPDALPPHAIHDALMRHGLPPAAVALEITEGVLMADVAVAQAWIGSLRTAGLRIYLDDFGTGYSSLSYLKRFPMDTVKIDKSFIRDMGADNSDRALVEAIVTMANSLGLNVVAEGIEDAQQLAILHKMGCGYGQGYYFSRPVKGEEFLAAVARIDAQFDQA